MGWEAGDYPRVGNTLQLMAERLVEAADVHAGQRVLDVACGQGNAAIAAGAPLRGLDRRRLCDEPAGAGPYSRWWAARCHAVRVEEGDPDFAVLAISVALAAAGAVPPIAGLVAPGWATAVAAVLSVESHRILNYLFLEMLEALIYDTGAEGGSGATKHPFCNSFSMLGAEFPGCLYDRVCRRMEPFVKASGATYSIVRTFYNPSSYSNWRCSDADSGCPESTRLFHL